MSLTPTSNKHKIQIQAGKDGRDRGHKFEESVAKAINDFGEYTDLRRINIESIIYQGNPGIILLEYLLSTLGIPNDTIDRIQAFWLGGLATSNTGDTLLDQNGSKIKASKSDIVIKIYFKNSPSRMFGSSVKACNQTTPTNDQLFFTTASAFCELLRRNGLVVSKEAEEGLKMFCGDKGYRPIDGNIPSERKSDPERWFWEELPTASRSELEKLITRKQDEITDILLRKAY
jgi:hypothetical protein